MANTLKFGNSEWYGTEGNILAYNDENGNFKPLPFDFSRGSKATRVNQQGLIETVGANDARVDYLDNANGAMLLEPQRTNLVTYSEDLNTYFTSKVNATFTSNYSKSPDGTNNSTRIQFSDGSSYALENIGTLTNTIASVYAKGVRGETIKFGFGNNVGQGTDITFSGGWERIFSYSTGVNLFFSTFGGQTARDFEIFGLQAEQGSYATSYIPTQGTAQTRLADICTNGGNDQVINSTEGVLYVEMNAFDNTSRISLSDGSTSNRVSFKITDDNIDFQYRVGGNYSYRVDVDVDNSNTNKIAMSFNNGVFVGYLNGVAIGSPISGTSLSQGVLDRLNFNDGDSSDSFQGNLKDLRVYNTALSNSELAALTQV